MGVFESVFQQLKAGPKKALRVYGDTMRAGFRLNEVADAVRALAVSDGKTMRLRDGFAPNPAAR